MSSRADQLVGGQFAGPTDSIFLCLSIKISFPKWERVKNVEKLRNIVDAEFYQIVIGCGCHDVAGPIAKRPSGPPAAYCRVKL